MKAVTNTTQDCGARLLVKVLLINIICWLSPDEGKLKKHENTTTGLIVAGE
jgi:hypothetical protein